MNKLQDTGSFNRGKIAGIDHLTLPVHDLEIAERFYTNILGAKVIFRTELSRPMPFIAITIGDSPAIDLFLQPWGQPALNQPHPHLAFKVRGEDLVDLKEWVAVNGIPTAGPVQFGPPGYASLYFNDPFGNHLELHAIDFAGELSMEPLEMEKLTYEWRG